MSVSENLFPSDDEVRLLAELSELLLASEFGASRDGLGVDAEATVRSAPLSKCLCDARKANGWTVKFCAQTLKTKNRQLAALEAGRFEARDGELLGRYVCLLGLDELYRQWLAANADLAARLGLSAPSLDVDRSADWPAAKPFTPELGGFRISSDQRTVLLAQLDRLEKALTKSAGPAIGFPGGPLIKDPRREPAPPAIYQLKITLRHFKPPIWRRVQVPNTFSLAQLHDVIQAAMGWENSHLHEFQVSKVRFGMTHDPLGSPLDWGGLQEILSEDDYRLCELGLRAKSKFKYDYDFGDGWEHEVVLEKVLSLPPDFEVVCLKGALACPVEDSGGVWGYTEKLAILDDPTHPEHEVIADWMGEAFDPEAFDLEAINHRLKSLSGSWSA